MHIDCECWWAACDLACLSFSALSRAPAGLPIPEAELGNPGLIVSGQGGTVHTIDISGSRITLHYIQIYIFIYVYPYRYRSYLFLTGPSNRFRRRHMSPLDMGQHANTPNKGGCVLENEATKGNQAVCAAILGQRPSRVSLFVGPGQKTSPSRADRDIRNFDCALFL